MSGICNSGLAVAVLCLALGGGGPLRAEVVVPIDDGDDVGVPWQDEEAPGVFRAVRITHVSPDSPADLVGLEVGDVIVAVNELPVADADDLAGALLDGGRRARLAVIDWRTGQVDVLVLTHRN